MNERIRALASLPALQALIQSARSDEAFSSPACVLDTNVLLDLLYWKDKEAAQLYEALKLGKLHALFSEATLEEFADVIAREPFGLLLDAQVALLRQALSLGALWKEALPPCGIRCKDADDMKFIDLAAASRARFLFTKDKRVLQCGKRLEAKTGTHVLTPFTFSLEPFDP